MTQAPPEYHLNGARDIARSALPVMKVHDVGGVDMPVFDVEMYTVLIETTMESAIGWLPPSLHPSVPAMMGITFYHARESAIGPFRLAVVGLGCRSGIKPRMLSLAAFVDSDAAGALFGDRLGYPVRVADVRLHARADSVRGLVSLGDKVILDVVTLDPVDIVGSGAYLKVWGPINHVETARGSIILQNEMSYDFKRLQRGDPRIDSFDEGELGIVGIRPTWPVMGALSTVDIAFQPTRYLLDTTVPAESGGITAITN